MGSFLDKPITDKETEFGRADGFVWVVASMQGWRAEMEDAHATITSVERGSAKHHFFGVFDGHGGKLAARVSASKLHEEIFRQFSVDSSGGDDSIVEARKCGDAMVKAFKKFDGETLRALPSFQSNQDCSGTTANVVYILPNYLVVANSGDSRCVLGCSGSKSKSQMETIPMSFDHKPKDKTERDRIIAAGGHVSMGRVDGDLAVSRALGDFIYKNPKRAPEKQKVSPVPDIKIHRRSEKDQFMILACDGIWDVMSNEDAVDFVSKAMSRGGTDMEEIAKELLDHCLLKGSRDNMSVIIIVFRGKGHAADTKEMGGV
eukprot:g2932.t1